MPKFYPSKWAQTKVYADALALALPAPSRAEIAERLYIATGEWFTTQNVGDLLRWIKKWQHVLGWTVCYAAKGKNPLETDRFYVIPNNHDSSWAAPEKDAACLRGLIAHFSSEATRQARHAKQALAQAEQTTDLRAKLLLQQQAALFDFLAKQAAGAAEVARLDLQAAGF